ncbi:MAG: response regulator transcription factor [Tissierellia bacterium]|nr:response regulator transcription factor [Tissierellia bacterium]
MNRILAIDDQLDMLVLIKNSLTREGHQVDLVQDPLSLDLEALATYDLILLDVMMPGLDGLSLCKKIRSQVDAPILFLTAKTQEEDLVEGLLAGGDDYITKPFGLRELSARIQAHLRREKRDKHTHLHRGRIHFDLSSREVFVEGEALDLTKSEYAISLLLAKRRGQVFSRDQIYDQVFGLEGTGDPSAISEHVKNIRAKFQKHGERPLVTVWGIGYKWE